MASLDKYHLQPILERTVQGDSQALNQLLATIRPYLHSKIRSRLGTGMLDRLDDSSIVQDSLLRISQNIGKLENKSVQGLLGWIARIVQYALVDAIRKRSREPIVPAGDNVLDVPAILSSADHCVKAEERDRLFAALARLSERERSVVQWRYFDRLSDAEISERLGGSVGAIRVLRCRALQQLRLWLQEAE
jgi:RNA polymerase sigma-70 factor (ECF subfamily)